MLRSGRVRQPLAVSTQHYCTSEAAKSGMVRKAGLIDHEALYRYPGLTGSSSCASFQIPKQRLSEVLCNSKRQRLADPSSI